MTRNKFYMEIIKVFKNNCISSDSIRGSFNNKDFHFIEKLNISYSDIDLMIPNCNEISKIKHTIRNEIIKCTSVDLSVSIHTHNSLSELSLKSSQDLAVLECIYQSTKPEFSISTYRLYIKAKFSLLISRINVNESYKVVANRINNKKSLFWIEQKKGIYTNLTINRNRWPNISRHRKFWNVFFNEKSNNDYYYYYCAIMKTTQLPTNLKKRINTKLRSNGIYWDE